MCEGVHGVLLKALEPIFANLWLQEAAHGGILNGTFSHRCAFSTHRDSVWGTLPSCPCHPDPAAAHLSWVSEDSGVIVDL